MATVTDKPQLNLSFSTEEAAEAMRRGTYDALRRRKKLGLPIYGWDDVNKCVLEIPADQIVIPAEYANDHPFPMNDQAPKATR